MIVPLRLMDFFALIWICLITLIIFMNEMIPSALECATRLESSLGERPSQAALAWAWIQQGGGGRERREEDQHPQHQGRLQVAHLHHH